MSTNADQASVWYLDINPTPSGVSDKSGKGHHSAWVSSSRASLWSGQ